MFNGVKVNKASVAPLAAEFLGTAVLVLVALVLTQTTAVSYFIGTSLVLTLGVVYLLFSAVSGAHVNPAVTFGCWVVRKIGTVPALAYIAAQLLGGVAAWKMFEYFTGQALPTRSSSWDWRVVLAEAVGTMILAMGFAATVSRGLRAFESALTYGAAYFVGIMVAATAAAGYLNPALAIASKNVNWTYIVAPLVGGAVGMYVYNYVFTGAAATKASRTKK